MNSILEEEFIKGFINKIKQERFIYELSSVKKRGEAIRQISSHIKKGTIIYSGYKIKQHEIENEITKVFDVNKEVYIISDSSLNGKMQSFKIALDLVMNSGSTSILLCDENTIFIKDEIGFEPAPMKYILHRTEQTTTTSINK